MIDLAIGLAGAARVDDRVIAWEAWAIRDDRPEPGRMGRSVGLLILPLTATLRRGDTVGVTLETATGAARPPTRPVLVGGTGGPDGVLGQLIPLRYPDETSADPRTPTMGEKMSFLP